MADVGVPGPATTMPPRVASVLAEVASQLEDEADQIAITMVEAYKAEIPQYAAIADDDLLRDVHTVSSVMVRCWLAVMRTGLPLEPGLLGPLEEGARRRAAQGFDLQALLRAYRIGIRVMWSEITGATAWRGRPLQGVLAQVGTWVLDFADRICTSVAAAYLEEAARAAREREHRRSSLLSLILAGPSSESLDALEELSGPHCVVLARTDGDPSLAQLEALGTRLESQAGALLWTVRHRSVVAAVALPADTARGRLRGQLSRVVLQGGFAGFGVGGRAASACETRQSYAEAVEALRIGSLLDGGAGATVHDHQELALIAAVAADPARARRLVADTLDVLEPVGNREWVLPTLEAYLVHQGRLKQVASALNIHQSTVKYRLNELRPLVHEALHDGEASGRLLLAIRVDRLLHAEAASAGRAPPAWARSPAGRQAS